MELEEELERIFQLLCNERWAEGEAALKRLQSPEQPPEVDWLWGHAFRGQNKLSDARAALQRAVDRDPNYADAHYVLAQVLKDLGEGALATEHELKTLRCDAEDEAEMQEDELQDELTFVEGIAERTLAELPDELRERLENVPLILSARPDEEMVRSGFDPRAFGVFEGPEDHDTRTEAPPTPARIVIFHGNLVSEYPEPELLEEQVRITVLHEVGHYFGLNEEQVAELGLA